LIFIGVPREQVENKIPDQIDIIKEMAIVDPNIAVEMGSVQLEID
jgi:hypothetical protein